MDAALRAELREAVDDVWAGTVRHLPMAGGAPDPGRDVAEIAAVLRTGDRAVERLNFGRGDNARGGVTASGGMLRIDRAVYPALVIRKKDKVVALDRPGEPVFEVRAVDDRSHLRLICELGDAN